MARLKPHPILKTMRSRITSKSEKAEKMKTTNKIACYASSKFRDVASHDGRCPTHEHDHERTSPHDRTRPRAARTPAGRPRTGRAHTVFTTNSGRVRAGSPTGQLRVPAGPRAIRHGWTPQRNVAGRLRTPSMRRSAHTHSRRLTRAQPPADARSKSWCPSSRCTIF